MSKIFLFILAIFLGCVVGCTDGIPIGNSNISSGRLIETKESYIDGCEYIEFVILDTLYGEASVLAHKAACVNHP